MTTDREVLIAAQARARQVLTAAAGRASGLLEQCNKDAAADLLKEQELAQRLLLEEDEQAVHTVENVEQATQRLSEADSVEYRERKRLIAESLRLAHERTAADLAKVEKALAAKVGEAMATAAVDILMDGHREAAAILLEARMSVTDRR